MPSNNSTNNAGQRCVVTCVFNGLGSVITVGTKARVEIPFNMTIDGWTIVSPQTGSCVIDVWKDTYANYPPAVGDTIAGTEKPTLSSQNKNQDLTLSTWNTSVVTGDILVFNVDSATTVQEVIITLRGLKTP